MRSLKGDPFGACWPFVQQASEAAVGEALRCQTRGGAGLVAHESWSPLSTSGSYYQAYSHHELPVTLPSPRCSLMRASPRLHLTRG